MAVGGIAFGGYLSSVRLSPKIYKSQSLAGITPIYRQFVPREHPTPVRTAVWSAASESFGAVPPMLRIEDFPESEELAAHLDGYSLAPDLAGRLVPSRGFMRGTASSSIGRVASTPNFDDASALVFQSSFSALFADIFDFGDSRRPERSGSPDEDRNPFTEAKAQERAEQSSGWDKEAQKPEQAASKQVEPPSDAAPAAKEEPGPSGAGSNALADSFIFLGDFAGSGQLSAVEARRIGDALFGFGAGNREFKISVNPAAVEYQRSFAVDDINGDGFADLVATSRASLLGSVLLGDGTGEFQMDSSFLTGYEPTVAVVGPVREGGREVLTLNLRTGITTAFRRQGHTYVQSRMNQLDLLPDYIAYLVGMADGSDNLLAAQAGRQPQVYKWMDDDRLAGLPALLPAEPALDLSPDDSARANLGGMQVYQIGPYASVILSNKSGQSFNVANLRVSPQIFLVLGNLEGRGTLDVGVAWLLPQDASR